jgi:hypothetical protein
MVPTSQLSNGKARAHAGFSRLKVTRLHFQAGGPDFAAPRSRTNTKAMAAVVKFGLRSSGRKPNATGRQANSLMAEHQVTPCSYSPRQHMFVNGESLACGTSRAAVRLSNRRP